MTDTPTTNKFTDPTNVPMTQGQLTLLINALQDVQNANRRNRDIAKKQLTTKELRQYDEEFSALQDVQFHIAQFWSPV